MSLEGPQKPEAPKAVSEPEEKSLEDLEKDLSPETIEQIMAKVEDINAPGNAFSVTPLSKLENILADGLLGYSYYWPEAGRRPSGRLIQEVNKDMWAKNTRAYKNALVHFNITGRMKYEQKGLEFTIANSEWMRDNSNDKIAVLFDLSKYKEDTPTAEATKDKLESRTFRINERYAGEKLVDPAYGFTLAHRVPPRFFKGIVFKLVTGETHKNEYGDLRGEECIDPVRYEEQANKIGKIMQELYQDKNDLLVPIYDHYGNLRWPKEMDYEEVKKFVEERDAENTEPNQKETTE